MLTLLRLLKCQILQRQSYQDSFMASVRSKVAVTRRHAVRNKHTSEGIRHAETEMCLPVMLATLHLTYALVLTSSTLSYLTSGRGENDKILHTCREVDFVETPLRFSNPSFSRSRINHWVLIFGQYETVPWLRKYELLNHCCASEMPQQRGHLCPLHAGICHWVTAGRQASPADNQSSSSQWRRARGKHRSFHRFSLWQETEQILFCKCKFKIYIITPNPPKLPRDIELMGSVKVFHTCVFLLCLILWEAFWRILQCKFQWDTYSLPQANCHSCRGLLPSCQSRQAGSMCSEITKKAGFIRLLKPN